MVPNKMTCFCALIALSLVQVSLQLLVTDARLPRHVVPEVYEIDLIPSFQENNFTLDGSVNIQVKVIQESENITLQIRDIQIKEVTVLNSIGEQLKITNTTNDKDQEFYIIYTEEPLQGNSWYSVKIKYEGQLNDQLVGFYRSSYRDSSGKIRWLGATQFQISDARRAFPCFDEPDFKAKFIVSIARPKHMNTISNMPVKETLPMAGRLDWEVDQFEESVRMSSYLVAFCISDFVFRNISLPGNTPFRIYARKEAIANGEADFAAEISARILKYFEYYTGVPYPLPKLDKVALPDFAYGAMENWGLVTYRETTLLLDNQVSSARNFQRVASVISHELAHMWFGNLVTPKWWNRIWLSEGFAVYFEGFGVDHVKPSWGFKEFQFSSTVQTSMKTDALKSTQSIFVKKAAALIRMMSMFLSEPILRRGIKNYLTEYQYNNTQQDDLWRHMTSEANEILPSGTTIKDIMDSWTLQEGFPVIKVQRNYDTDSANVSQERFLLFNRQNETKPQQSWWVPLTYTSQASNNFNVTEPSVWMNQNQTNTTLLELGSNSQEWVIFNIQQAGYYRVCYDDKNWQLIAAQLQNDHEVIPAIQRSQLLNDALNLARATHMNYPLALSLTSYLSREKSYTPLKTGLEELEYIWNMLIRKSGGADFLSYMKGIVYPLYKDVENQGWDGNYTDLLNVYWKVMVTEWACKLEHDGCINEMKEQFSRFMSTGEQVNPNLKSTIYCTAIKYGAEKEWAFLWEHYKNTSIGNEKEVVLNALGCSRNIWILSRYLDWILNESSGIRKQDGPSVFRAIAFNPVARCLAWNFLRSNWKKVNQLYGAVFHSIRRFISSSTRDFNTEKEVEELKQFQDENKNDFGKATREVIQSAERAEMNYEWMKNNYVQVVQWFKERNGN